MQRSRSSSRAHSLHPHSPSQHHSHPSSPLPRGRAVSRPPQSYRHGSSSSSSSSSPHSRSSHRSSSHHRRHSVHHHEQYKADHHHHGMFKTTAGLLAGIGVAAVLAHKVWPKGVIHGDDEEWMKHINDHEKPSEHHRHHHANGHHHHHHHHHSERRLSDSEVRSPRRAYSTRGRDDVVYHDELPPARSPRQVQDVPAHEYPIRRLGVAEAAFGSRPRSIAVYPDERLYRNTRHPVPMERV